MIMKTAGNRNCSSKFIFLRKRVVLEIKAPNSFQAAQIKKMLRKEQVTIDNKDV